MRVAKMIEQRLYGVLYGAESINSKIKSKIKEVIKRLSRGLPGKQSAEAAIYYFYLGDLVLRHQDG